MYKHTVSLSCIDLGHIERSLNDIERLPIESLHYDVVDGRFNQCFIFGDICLKTFGRYTSLPITVHLACYEPRYYIEPMIKNGAKAIAIHYESNCDILKTFELIKQLGAMPVLAFCCDSEIPDDFIEIAKEASWIIQLMVKPGFAGQAMETCALERIREMRRLLNDNDINIDIEADGNINLTTIDDCIKAGATKFTLGTSSLFDQKDTIFNNFEKLVKKEQQYANNDES